MVASMPKHLGGYRACGHVFKPGLPTHLVQELNAGTVVDCVVFISIS